MVYIKSKNHRDQKVIFFCKIFMLFVMRKKNSFIIHF